MQQFDSDSPRMSYLAAARQEQCSSLFLDLLESVFLSAETNPDILPALCCVKLNFCLRKTINDHGLLLNSASGSVKNPRFTVLRHFSQLCFVVKAFFS